MTDFKKRKHKHQMMKKMPERIPDKDTGQCCSSKPEVSELWPTDQSSPLPI